VYHISLSKITPEGGVAYSQVTSILEDNQGFIWFSTNNGLFSYNSIEIKRYSYMHNDVFSLPTKTINNTFYKANNGFIWVANVPRLQVCANMFAPIATPKIPIHGIG